MDKILKTLKISLNLRILASWTLLLVKTQAPIAHFSADKMIFHLLTPRLPDVTHESHYMIINMFAKSLFWNIKIAPFNNLYTDRLEVEKATYIFEFRKT